MVTRFLVYTACVRLYVLGTSQCGKKWSTIFAYIVGKNMMLFCWEEKHVRSEWREKVFREGIYILIKRWVGEEFQEEIQLLFCIFIIMGGGNLQAHIFRSPFSSLSSRFHTHLALFLSFPWIWILLILIPLTR